MSGQRRLRDARASEPPEGQIQMRAGRPSSRSPDSKPHFLHDKVATRPEQPPVSVRLQLVAPTPHALSLRPPAVAALFMARGNVLGLLMIAVHVKLGFATALQMG